MHTAYRGLPIAIVLLLIATGVACAQAPNSLDISIPASYAIAPANAFDSNYTAVELSGSIDVFKYNGGTYLSIPTNAPEGDKLSFFQDTNTWALFRNDTLVLPLRQGDVPVASLVLMTDDLVCANGRFYGQVTGMELDVTALGDADASADTVLYLNSLPDHALYHISLSDDENVRNAVLNEASKSDRQAGVKLMLEVSGGDTDSQSSIGYAIVRMKPSEALNGNVTAFLYRDGEVKGLSSKPISSNGTVIYETIDRGPGTFVFLGPIRAQPPVRAGMRNVLIFSGALAVSLILVTGVVVKTLKWSAKKQ